MFSVRQSMRLREMTSGSWWRASLCGDWSLNLNVQVFIEGDPDNEEQYFLNTDGTEPIQVTDPCQNYAVEAQVAGAQLACAGLTTDVTVEFLGLDEAAEGTMYQLVTSMDGFMEDNQVLSETPQMPSQVCLKENIGSM